MAQQKINKEYCLTDNSVNVYSYRCLTEGIQLNRYTPAIGFLMHNREKGVAVRWEDFRFDGDKLYAKPVVNTTAFPDLAQQIEDGFYDAASCGKIVALEWSDDKAMKLEGQTGITVTKWFPRDISIVDIPGNYNALAKIYDETDNVLMDLSDTNKGVNSIIGKKPVFSATLTIKSTLNLKDNATSKQITVALTDLRAKAHRVNKAEKALEDLNRIEVDKILNKGRAEQKLTKDLADKLRKTYANNPKGLEDLISSIKVRELPEKYKGKTFSDLYKTGELEDVKTNYPLYYETIKTNK
ncbi:MAG: hypothetical protein PHR83_08005 [Paludibacter sp.]|nr:hypothetical protein [Paludibacter sp.]